MRLTKNFILSEFDYNDGTAVPEMYIKNVHRLANELQSIRNHINIFLNFGVKKKIEYYIDIISGYRTPTHNYNCGGAKNSFHPKAMAGDYKVYYLKKRLLRKVKRVYVDATKIYDITLYLINAGKIKDGGLGKYKTFTHYDIRDVRARW